jgi:hypothetical protein
MSHTPPDAELLIAPGCPHCPAVLAALAELVKKNALGRVDIINIASHPEEAEARGVRGVPWIRIGPFELNGAHTPAELASWVDRASSTEGHEDFIREGLEAGGLGSVTAACRRSATLRPALLRLAGDLETPFAVRVGIGAVLEDLAADGQLAAMVPDLTALADSEHAQVRADAAHYLGLAGTAEAIARLRELQADDDHEVREIASDALVELGDTTA